VLSYIGAYGLLAVLDSSLFYQKAICLGATLFSMSSKKAIGSCRGGVW
jgi:hypothetical protein